MENVNKEDFFNLVKKAESEYEREFSRTVKKNAKNSFVS